MHRRAARNVGHRTQGGPALTCCIQAALERRDSGTPPDARSTERADNLRDGMAAEGQ